jgi:hypothetical protein
MVKIEVLYKEKKISRIIETEQDRYVNFFLATYKDNLVHSKENIHKHPRWSIISGYYAMHDISKLFIAKIYRLKIDREIHATTIKVLKELLKDKEILRLIEKGLEEYQSLSDELNDAKKDRVKIQYYTGTPFLKEKYANKSESFLNNIVMPYVNKIELIMKKNDN